MKAIIAAGGHGSRLRPITWTMNKHLIPIANEPLLLNAIKKIAAVGVTEIAINVNPGEEELQKVFGDGSKWGVSLTYIEQSGGACGIGMIPYNAREFLGDGEVLYYLGDNIILGELQRFVDKFRNDDLDCCLAFSKVKDASIFGTPEFDDSGKLVGIVEKPEEPQTDFAVTGIYLYKMEAYLKAFANIKREDSTRNEYEISHIHDWFLKNNYKLGYEEITGWWKDTGMPEDMVEGNQLLLNEMTQADATIDESVTMLEGARIQGRVKIGKNTAIGPNTLIRGPVVIGEDVTIENSFIGPHTSIGSGSRIADSEIEHSIIMNNATVRTHKRIVDSIVGHNAKLVAQDDTYPRGHRMVVGENSYLEL